MTVKLVEFPKDTAANDALDAVVAVGDWKEIVIVGIDGDGTLQCHWGGVDVRSMVYFAERIRRYAFGEDME